MNLNCVVLVLNFTVLYLHLSFKPWVEVAQRLVFYHFTVHSQWLDLIMTCDKEKTLWNVTDLISQNYFLLGIDVIHYLAELWPGFFSFCWLRVERVGGRGAKGANILSAKARICCQIKSTNQLTIWRHSLRPSGIFNITIAMISLKIRFRSHCKQRVVVFYDDHRLILYS